MSGTLCSVFSTILNLKSPVVVFSKHKRELLVRLFIDEKVRFHWFDLVRINDVMQDLVEYSIIFILCTVLFDSRKRRKL